jgi:predicted Zn-dependent protease
MDNPYIQKTLVDHAKKFVEIGLDKGIEELDVFFKVDDIKQLSGNVLEHRLENKGLDANFYIKATKMGESHTFVTNSLNDQTVNEFKRSLDYLLTKIPDDSLEGSSKMREPQFSNPVYRSELMSDLSAEYVQLTEELNQYIGLFQGSSTSIHLENWKQKHVQSYKGIVTSGGKTLNYSSSYLCTEFLLESEYGYLYEGDFSTRNRKFPFKDLYQRLEKLVSWPRGSRVNLREGSIDLRISPHIACELARKAGVLLSGDKAKQYTQMQGWLNKQIFPSHLTLIDDALLTGGWATRPFDDEGTDSQKTVMIDKGVLKSFVHSKKTAQFFNVPASGNASFSTRHDTIKIGLSNIYFQKGATSHKAWQSKTSYGLDIVHAVLPAYFNGNGADIHMIVDGWIVENGEQAYPISGVSIKFNLFRFLRKITGIGEDLTFSYISQGAVSPSLYIKDGQVAAGMVSI